MTKKTYKWNEYVKEAEKPPLEIELPDGRTAKVEAPTGEQVAEAQELARVGAGVKDQIKVICGDASDDLLPLMMEAPAGAMNEFFEDVMKHFGMSPGEATSRT